MEMEDLKISICIPTWEQYGLGVSFLKKLIQSIEIQTYDNYEIVISDHSIDDSIKEFIINNPKVKYFRNENNRGNSPYNTNNAIKNSSGDIIKIMFQDDFFFNPNSLFLINQRFKDPMCEWVVNGCNHSYDGETFNRPMIPSWNDDIIVGNNTISSPSVLSFRSGNGIYFDENLTMLMDCDYYYQLYLKFGEPRIISDILITNRVHNKQISSMYNKNINDEINYVKNKYKL